MQTYTTSSIFVWILHIVLIIFYVRPIVENLPFWCWPDRMGSQEKVYSLQLLIIIHPQYILCLQLHELNRIKQHIYGPLEFFIDLNFHIYRGRVNQWSWKGGLLEGGTREILSGLCRFSRWWSLGQPPPTFFLLFVFTSTAFFLWISFLLFVVSLYQVYTL